MFFFLLFLFFFLLFLELLQGDGKGEILIVDRILIDLGRAVKKG